MNRKMTAVVLTMGFGLIAGLFLADHMTAASAQGASYSNLRLSAEPVAAEMCVGPGDNLPGLIGTCTVGAKYCWETNTPGGAPMCVDSPTPTFPGWPPQIGPKDAVALVVVFE